MTASRVRLGLTLVLFYTIELCRSAWAQAPVLPLPQTELAQPGTEPMEWRRSFAKSLSYQAIVVTTDQIIFYVIVTGTPVAEIEFFAANAVTGVVYYVFFDDTWKTIIPQPASADGHVSFAKAVVYRAFDTARVFAVSFAIGTPLAGSIAVTAASAVVRTCIYILHDYVWSFISYGREPASPVQKE